MYVWNRKIRFNRNCGTRFPLESYKTHTRGIEIVETGSLFRLLRCMKRENMQKLLYSNTQQSHFIYIVTVKLIYAKAMLTI